MSGKTASDKAIFNMRWEIDGCMTILIHLMKPYLKNDEKQKWKKKDYWRMRQLTEGLCDITVWYDWM